MKLTSRLFRGLSVLILWGPVVLMSAYSADNNVADLEKINKLFKQAAQMTNISEKAIKFEVLDNLISPYISESLKIQSIEEYKTLVRLKAFCLFYGADALRNCWTNKIVFPNTKGIDLLIKSANKAQISQTLFNQNQDKEYEEMASACLFVILRTLSEEYLKSALSQKSSNSNHLTACENFLSIFTFMQGSCTITIPSNESKSTTAG